MISAPWLEVRGGALNYSFDKSQKRCCVVDIDGDTHLTVMVDSSSGIADTDRRQKFAIKMEDDSEDGDDLVYVDEEPSHFTRSTRQCDVGSSRAHKGKHPAQTLISSRLSKPLMLEDEDDMEEDIGVSCDEADEPVLEFDDDDFGDY
ncbi:hypothetical protein Tco_0821172 [Tanacetum coccineum]|uniref:Transcription elongation factor Eaf N-terminal domain-containing protein n=1 Tax=Tanacetum coccineum TaxID=301880 RepID=A0ABQ5AFU2_9ASTR